MDWAGRPATCTGRSEEGLSTPELNVDDVDSMLMSLNS
jgi:hypothetical protein